MPSRKVPFVDEEYYHVFNRGVNHMRIFTNEYDYSRFMKTLLYYQIAGKKPRFSIFAPTTTNLDKSHKLVKVVCYCLMPNHFHFLLKQSVKNGITEFMSKLSNSYTKYFNLKNGRSGPLLGGEFKSVHIDTDEQLVHLSRYIHLNPVVSYLVNEPRSYKWSSYLEFLNLSSVDICSKEIITDQFKINPYEKFVMDQIDYARSLELSKHQLIDNLNKTSDYTLGV